MTKTESLRVGLALNHIAMMCNDVTLKKIDTFLKEIEEIILKDVKSQEALVEEIRTMVDHQECDARVLSTVKNYLIGEGDVS